VVCLILMRDVTHSYAGPTRIEGLAPAWSTGWQRCIECLKLQVIYRKRATNYRALLRKMTCEDKASYDFTPLCMTHSRVWCDSLICGAHIDSGAHICVGHGSVVSVI